MTLTAAPVDEQILGQEGTDDEPRSVVHPAGGHQLAHRGVDDRIARSACAPRLEVVFVLRPGHALELGQIRPARHTWSVPQDVVVELAPDQLAAVGVRSPALPLGPSIDLQRRQQAPMEVLTESGSAVRGQIIPTAVVVIQA